jgi:hypothetical protein
MNQKSLWLWLLGLALICGGCSTPIPPGAERGPHGTMAYDVLIEASAPGARIEANGEEIGTSPVHLKIFGDPDGTFHDFGSYYYVIRALPVATNQFVQTRVFYTGHLLTPEDRIPQRINFEMNQAPPPGAPPGYVYPAYPPPVYYWAPPPYYYYYWPSYRCYYGPRYYPNYYHHR